MRVGIDARVLYRPLRGVGKYLFQVIKNIAELDSSVNFLLFYEEITGNKNVPDVAQISERKFTLKGYRFQSWEQFRLPWEIKKSNVNLFHAPANTAPLFQSCPTVVTLHDTLLMESEETKNHFYYRTVLPLALRKTKKIITISHNSKRDIIRFLGIPEDRIKVIYHGIDGAFHKIEDRQSLLDSIKKYGIRDKYIFALGAVGKRKNTDTLIDAFSMLKKERKIAHQLVISGIQGVGVEEYTKKINALGLPNDIIITGYIPEQDLVALYNAAEAFTYLSLYEGFGFPILESMSCGTPVVASNVSSIPELVDNAGILVNPKDINEIGNAIYSILSNKDLQNNLIEEGFKQAQKFSWKKAAQQTLNVYKEVARGVN